MSIYLPTSLTDCYTLSNGVKIPAIGYGTWQTPNDVTADLVKTDRKSTRLNSSHTS